MSLSIGNRLNGIIPRGALAQVRSSADTGNGFTPVHETASGDQSMLQHGRARDLAGTMPPATWQVLADAHEHPEPAVAREIDRSYGYVQSSNALQANPKEFQAA